MSYQTTNTPVTTRFFDRLRRLRQSARFAAVEYRHAVNEIEFRSGIRSQIRALRESRGWSQEQLGAAMGGVAQSNVARIESGRKGYLHPKTLLQIARAFDVGVVVRFVPFSDVAEWVSDYSTKAAAPPSYADEVALAGTYEQNIAIVSPGTQKPTTRLVAPATGRYLRSETRGYKQTTAYTGRG